MKKIFLSVVTAACLMVALPSHTVVKQAPQTAAQSALFRVKINLVGTNGLPAAGSFYFYAWDVNTGDFYEFDYYEDAYLIPAGTYIFGGDDATGSGWCGISGTQATINCNTTVTLRVWCE
jgi:hypothetical protein